MLNCILKIFYDGRMCNKYLVLGSDIIPYMKFFNLLNSIIFVLIYMLNGHLLAQTRSMELNNSYYKTYNYSLSEFDEDIYINSIDENQNIQRIKNTRIKLSIYNKSNHVIAKVILFNDSDESLYFHRRFTPINNEMCSNAFFIITKSIVLRYLGGSCRFSSGFDRSEWIKIPARHAYIYKVNLDEQYEFLPGNNFYNIGTREFSFASNNWVLGRQIYTHLFRVLDFCGGEKCVFYFNENRPSQISEGVYIFDEMKASNFIQRYFPQGDNNMFEVRSNQITINIIGNELRRKMRKAAMDRNYLASVLAGSGPS